MFNKKNISVISRKVVVIFSLMVLSSCLSQQNLVLNSSFNQRKKNVPLHWYALYNYQLVSAKNGRKNVARFLIYTPGGFTRFLTGGLKQPLQKGRTYKFSCFIHADITVDSSNFGVLFLKEPLRFTGRESVMSYVADNPQDFYPFKIYNRSTGGWLKTEVEFTAAEPYSHFMVGYYGNYKSFTYNAANVYFDQFSLEPVK